MGIGKRIRKKIKKYGRKAMGYAGAITRIPMGSGSKYQGGYQAGDDARAAAAGARIVEKPVKRQGGSGQVKYTGRVMEGG